MSKSLNSENEQEDNKIDWNELIGESPKYVEISKFQFTMIITLILFIYLVIQASIWGLWAGGTQ